MEVRLDLDGLPAAIVKLVPASEAECVERLMAWRWGDTGFKCRRCGGDRAYAMRERPRVMCCAFCTAHNSVTAGTLLHGSRVDLRCWFLAAALLMRTQGCSATEFANRTGMHRQSGWRILHRLRAAAAGASGFLLSGAVRLACYGVRCKQPRRWPTALVTTLRAEDGGLVHVRAGRGWEQRRAVWRHAPHVQRVPDAATDNGAAVRIALMAVRRQLSRTHRWVSARWLDRYLATATFRGNHRVPVYGEGLLALALRHRRATFDELAPPFRGLRSARPPATPSRRGATAR